MKQQVINNILELANRKYPLSEVYLFGSRARGDATNDSDWDVLLLLDYANLNFEIETQILDDFYELELETGELISPIIYLKSDWENKKQYTSIYQSIKNEGIKLK